MAKDTRRELWRKLIRDSSSSVVSALSRLTLGQLGTDTELRDLIVDVMREILAVAAALGWDLRSEFDARETPQRATTRGVTVRSSMLRNVLEKRPLEADPASGRSRHLRARPASRHPSSTCCCPCCAGWIARSVQLRQQPANRRVCRRTIEEAIAAGATMNARHRALPCSHRDQGGARARSRTPPSRPKLP